MLTFVGFPTTKSKKIQVLDEIQCINALRNGSYKAFNMIYEEYADQLYMFVLLQLRDHNAAADIVQETYMRLWANRSHLNCFGNLKQFIFAIARYRIIDLLRKRMSQPRFEEYLEYCSDMTDSPMTPEDVMMYDDFLRQLAKAKEKLTPREREIYELSREHQLSSAEIARRLGLAEQTVKNTLTAALKTLRTALAGSSMMFLFWI